MAAATLIGEGVELGTPEFPDRRRERAVGKRNPIGRRLHAFQCHDHLGEIVDVEWTAPVGVVGNNAITAQKRFQIEFGSARDRAGKIMTFEQRATELQRFQDIAGMKSIDPAMVLTSPYSQEPSEFCARSV